MKYTIGRERKKKKPNELKENRGDPEFGKTVEFIALLSTHRI